MPHETEAFGLEMEPLPEGWTPLEAVSVVKCLDEEGHVALVSRTTEGLASWDSIGMLIAALDTQREELRRGFTPDRDDDDEDS